jgi:predicted lipoprotein with Yx(FWY)xxD motif
MISLKKLALAPILAAVLVAGCSSAAVTQAPPAPTGTVAGATATTPPSTAPSVAGSSSAAASGATVMSATAGGSSVLVAGSNGMTVYTFSKDTANGATSACTGACATKWPPLTVPAGTTPTVGSGASGKIGTIAGADSSSLQVTYNGLPLYFYSGDKAPGDTNGSYPNWNLVTP